MSLGEFSEFLFGDNLHWQVVLKSGSLKHSCFQMKIIHRFAKDLKEENSIMCRDKVLILLKEITPDTLRVANHTRHEWARSDAFILVSEAKTRAKNGNNSFLKMQHLSLNHGIRHLRTLRNALLLFPDNYRIFDLKIAVRIQKWTVLF